MILHDKTGQPVAQRFVKDTMAMTGSPIPYWPGHWEHMQALAIVTVELSCFTNVTDLTCIPLEMAETDLISHNLTGEPT